jgi:hypothetical protein
MILSNITVTLFIKSNHGRDEGVQETLQIWDLTMGTSVIGELFHIPASDVTELL